MPNETQIQTTISKEIPISIGKQSFLINEEAKQILLRKTPSGYKADEVATLGDNDVFVRREGKSQLKLITADIRLWIQNKDIVQLGNKEDSPWMITIQGYNKLNQIAGVYIATPRVELNDGTFEKNPSIEYNGKEMVRIIARKIAIGYSPAGNLVAIDTVRHYNFDAYFMQDIQAKAKWKPDAAKFGTMFLCPFAPDKPPTTEQGHIICRTDSKIYTFKPIKDAEGIWIDPSHNEIQEVYNQHTQHQKFGDVIAQSMTVRNALKAHPAIAQTNVVVKKGSLFAEVRVFGFRHGMSSDQLKEMSMKISQGDKPENVEVVRDSQDVEANEFQILGEAEANDGTEQSMAGGEAEQSGLSAEIDFDQTMKQVVSLATEKNINLITISKNMFDSRLENLTSDQLKKLLNIVKSTDAGKKSNDKGGK